MSTPRLAILPTFLILSATPAWACGGGGVELLLLILGFFATEAFACSLVAGFLAQHLMAKKLAFPKLTMLGSVVLGTGSGLVACLAGSEAGSVGMVVSTAAASGLAAALVAYLSPAAKQVNTSLEEPIVDSPQLEPPQQYDTAPEWKPH